MAGEQVESGCFVCELHDHEKAEEKYAERGCLGSVGIAGALEI